MHPLTDPPSRSESEVIPHRNVRVGRRVQGALGVVFEALRLKGLRVGIPHSVVVNGVDVADDPCATGDAVAHVLVVSGGGVRDPEDQGRSPA